MAARSESDVISMTPAPPDRRPWSALGAVVLFLVGLGGLILLVPHDPNIQRDPAGSVALICAFAAFDLVGALIIWRRPHNALGWIMAAIGLLAAWGALADTYADTAYHAGQRSDVVYEMSVWISLWYWYPLLGLTLLFTPLLFPDGRPPSPRWRAVIWVAGVDLALITFLAAFHEKVRFAGISMDNPVGIPGIENPEQSRFGAILFGLLLLLLGVALASVVVRYLRSGGVAQHQIKWLLLPSALAVLQLLSEALLGDLWESEVPFAVVVGLFPVSIAVAILRYRLYDIDVLINRTLVYGTLTTTLVALYFSGIVVLQRLFVLLTGQKSTLAVVVSTLVIAALFVPLRRGVQGFVDRRFYRRKYDAAKTLAAFNARLRDETELETLSSDVVGVVRETMQPAHVSLWLRPDTASKGQPTE
jgi:hypothetical protein